MGVTEGEAVMEDVIVVYGVSVSSDPGTVGLVWPEGELVLTDELASG